MITVTLYLNPLSSVAIAEWPALSRCMCAFVCIYETAESTRVRVCVHVCVRAGDSESALELGRSCAFRLVNPTVGRCGQQGG